MRQHTAVGVTAAKIMKGFRTSGIKDFPLWNTREYCYVTCVPRGHSIMSLVLQPLDKHWHNQLITATSGKDGWKRFLSRCLYFFHWKKKQGRKLEGSWDCIQVEHANLKRMKFFQPWRLFTNKLIERWKKSITPAVTTMGQKCNIFFNDIRLPHWNALEQASCGKNLSNCKKI